MALLLVDSWEEVDRTDGAVFLDDDEGCFECRRRLLVVEGISSLCLSIEMHSIC